MELLAWASIAFLAVVFFRIDHSLGYSTWRPGVGGPLVAAPRLDAVAEGNVARRIGYAVLAVFAAINLLRPRLIRVRLESFGVLAAVAFLGWAFASLLWATAPWITGRRLLGLLVTVLLVYSIHTRWPARDILRLFCVMTLGYLIVGIAVELRNGTLLSVMSNRFVGTLPAGHQAVQCGILLLALVWLAGERRGARLPPIAIGVAVLGFLLLTQARTVVAATLLSLLLLWFLQGRIGWLLLSILSGLSALAFGALLASNGFFPGAVAVLNLGRGTENVATLTGRIPLWRTLLEHFQERPLVGFGYNGYMEGDRAAQIASEVGGWAFGGAHSAYMSVALGLGLIGVVLFLVLLVFHLVRVAYCRSEMQGLHVLFACVVFLHVVNGIMDSSWVEPAPNFLGWLALGYLVLVPPPPGRPTSNAHVRSVEATSPVAPP